MAYRSVPPSKLHLFDAIQAPRRGKFKTFRLKSLVVILIPFLADGLIYCECGHPCKRSKTRWIKHLRGAHPQIYAQIVNQQLGIPPEELDIFDAQLELISDDDDDTEKVL